MKHILPILSLALLGAAMAAFADETDSATETASATNGKFYYDYYKGPGKSDLGNEYLFRDFGGGGPNGTNIYWNIYETQTDSFSYHDFSVARYSDWANIGSEAANNYWENNKGTANIDNSNFYRIQVSGNNVDLYLTDFVDNVGSPTNENALYNHIAEYGYRKLELVDGKYVATGDLKKYTITVPEGSNTPVITEVNGPYNGPAQKIDTLSFTREEAVNGSETVEVKYDVDRYEYYLGTFNDTDIIELYMKDLNDGEAYSYSGINEIDSTTNAPVGAEGGFGDGGYRVNLETDEMLNGYYYQDENLQPEYRGFGYDEAGKAARALASSKSMPLSALDPSGERVYFGIIASVDGVIYSPIKDKINGNGASGSPLPGGLQIAMIAGLFGLGFWYIRRRKATVA